MRKLATLLLLALAAPALAAPPLTDTAPLLAQPVLSFDGTQWQADSTHPSAYLVGMTRAEGMTEGEGPVIAARQGAPRSGKGGVAQVRAAEEWRGKRVRLTARLKSRDAFAQMVMHILSGPAGTENMRSIAARPLLGTSDWQNFQIVMDVPKDAEDIVYGFYLSGDKGAVWGDAFKLEAVGTDVAPSRPPLAASFTAPSMIRSYSGDSD